MCFWKEFGHERHEIAEEDIVTYKAVEKVNSNNFKSMYYSFHYASTIGYGKVVDLEELDKKRFLTKEVFHSYANADLAGNELAIRPRPRCYAIVKCIIPKGSAFWYNSEKGEYASECIKIIEEVETV